MKLLHKNKKYIILDKDEIYQWGYAQIIGTTSKKMNVGDRFVKRVNRYLPAINKYSKMSCLLTVTGVDSKSGDVYCQIKFINLEVKEVALVNGTN